MDFFLDLLEHREYSRLPHDVHMQNGHWKGKHSSNNCENAHIKLESRRIRRRQSHPECFVCMKYVQGQKQR